MNDSHEKLIRELVCGTAHKLQEASTLAQAASHCANNGDSKNALKVLMDIEPPTRDALAMMEAGLVISSLQNS